MKIYRDPVTQWWWENDAPRLQHLLIKRPLESIHVKRVSSWKSPEFLAYWRERFEGKFGFQPQVVNQARVGAQFKLKVIDYFYEQVPIQIKNFLDYVIDSSKVPNDARAEFLPHKVNDYMSSKWSQGFKSGITSRSTSDEEMSNLAEKQSLEYYGTGFSDEDLTKEEYWVGLKWRQENLRPAEIEKMNTWHRSKFQENGGKSVLERLERWKREFDNISENFNLKRQFYLLESHKMKKTLRNVLKIYHSDSITLFTDEELDKVNT